MDKPYGIIVFGANGVGKTTLARELACVLGFKHVDGTTDWRINSVNIAEVFNEYDRKI